MSSATPLIQHGLKAPRLLLEQVHASVSSQASNYGVVMRERAQKCTIKDTGKRVPIHGGGASTDTLPLI
eukprot:SAG31_NODE_25918_length_451_cov_1.278409_2_plen_68_part_01